MNSVSRGAIVLLAVILSAGIVAAGRDDEPQNSGEKLLTAELVRAADFVAASPGITFPAAAGSGPLKSGSIEVSARRKVDVRLDGASAKTRYTVYFCRHPAMLFNCASLGEVETDASGDAQESLNFQLAGGVWAGVFVLAKSGAGQTIEYLSGFAFPPEVSVSPASVRIGLEGKVLLVDLGRSSFRLTGFPLEIVINSTTRFKHAQDLRDLVVGSTVTVEGSSMADGRILAANVDAGSPGQKKD